MPEMQENTLKPALKTPENRLKTALRSPKTYAEKHAETRVFREKDETKKPLQGFPKEKADSGFFLIGSFP